MSGIGRLITVHLAPQQIVAAFDIEFADDLRASEIERAAASIEELLKAKHPDIMAVFVTSKRPTVTITKKLQLRSESGDGPPMVT